MRSVAVPVPTVSAVLWDLLPAFVVGLLEDLRRIVRELVADLLTFTRGDVSWS